MLRKIYMYLLIVSTVLFTISCSEDYLDTTPTDAISADDALSSPENMMLILEGLHRQMYAQSPLPGAESSRSGQSHFIPALDAMGGNIIHSSPGNGWMTSDLQWRTHINAGSTTVENFWYQRYHFIASCNSIINEVAEGEFVIDEEMNNILAQAHAYSATCAHLFSVKLIYCIGLNVLVFFEKIQTGRSGLYFLLAQHTVGLLPKAQYFLKFAKLLSRKAR